MRRREFFAAVAVASVLPRTIGRAGARTVAPAPLKLGVASYLLRKFSLDRALEIAKALNYRGGSEARSKYCDLPGV